MTYSSNAATPTKSQWLSAVEADLKRVTRKIRDASFLNDQLLDAAVTMILEAGGKRLRPTITLLVGQACHAPIDKLIPVAASVELLHTATLVHDDLVDNANERRGAPTLHTQLPLGVTVLTGDFLFAQSAALAAEADNVRVVKNFSAALVSICKGEILQAQTKWQVPSSDIYQQRIYGKTAALFEAAALAASLLSDLPEPLIQAYGHFGRELGMAYQIIDDALDFVATSDQLGKPAGHDLREGHVTLPAMLYIENHKIDPVAFIEQVRNPKGVEEIIHSIRENGAARAAIQAARNHIQAAEDALADVEQGPAIEALFSLASYVIDRDF
ncbi:MAG: polyprenyl synthetase family protein [Anaerolineales bacterium]|nr:polyprenyl synthetase family protein [Anaerolineales bacterium]